MHCALLWANLALNRFSWLQVKAAGDKVGGAAKDATGSSSGPLQGAAGDAKSALGDAKQVRFPLCPLGRGIWTSTDLTRQRCADGRPRTAAAAASVSLFYAVDQMSIMYIPIYAAMHLQCRMSKGRCDLSCSRNGTLLSSRYGARRA